VEETGAKPAAATTTSSQRVSAATSPCSHPAADTPREGEELDSQSSSAAGAPAARPGRSTRRRLLTVFLLTLLGIAGAAVAPGSVTPVPFPLFLVILLVGLVILLIATAPGTAAKQQQQKQKQKQQTRDAAVSSSSGGAGGSASPPGKKLSRAGAAAAAVASCYDDIAGLLASVPRTARTLNWAVRAGLSYKRYLTLADPYDAVEYAKGLNALHEYWGQVRPGGSHMCGWVNLMAPWWVQHPPAGSVSMLYMYCAGWVALTTRGGGGGRVSCLLACS
jgi:hypothetical protein